MERRLGRGLGALLGDSAATDARPSPAHLTPEQLRPNPFQPRKLFDPDALSELAESIRAHGILQPIVVRATADGYEIISGERRWRAARQVGLLTVPVIVRDRVPDEQMLELALVENVQRQDLDAIERARGYRQMMTALSITQEDVARKVGLKRATVANHIRLLELPELVQESVGRGLVSMGHARALLGHPDPKQLRPLVERIVRDGLSVRQVESMVRDATKVLRSKERHAATPVRKPWINELESRLRERLGSKVTLKNGPGYRGQIVIDYYDRADLERLCAVLAPRERI